MKLRDIVCGAAALALVGGALSACSSTESGGTLVELTAYAVRGDNELIRFNPDQPSLVEVVGTISPLNGSETIVGLDFRPAEDDEQLYALTQAGRLLTVDVGTAAATAIDGFDPVFDDEAGIRFGMDFNPTGPVALRLVNSAGENRRVLPPFDEPALVDGQFGYLQSDVLAAAYTNPVSGTAGTALYLIGGEPLSLLRAGSDPATGGDCNEERPYPEGNPNCGGLLQISELEVEADDVQGYDIAQIGTVNEHYVLLEVDGDVRIFTVDPGASPAAAAVSATLPGSDYRALVFLPDGDTETEQQRAFALLRDDDGEDVIDVGVLDLDDNSFTVDSTVTVTGLEGDDRLLSLDLRSADVDLMGDDTAYGIAESGTLYQLDLEAASASSVEAEAVAELNTGGDNLTSVRLLGERFAIDFNPRADRLRLVSDQGQNLRINVGNGVTVTDKSLRSLAGPTPMPVATAYLNSFIGATNTIQIIVDAQDNSLARVLSPNDGLLTRIGDLFDGEAALDPSAPQTLDVAAGTALFTYATLVKAGETQSTMYIIDVPLGDAIPVGLVGEEGEAVISGLAVRLTTDDDRAELDGS
jgi:hypothetical protein